MMYDEVLMHARDLDAFKREVAAVGGRIRHSLTPHLVVVAFPKRVRETPFRNGATVESELLEGKERELAEAWIGRFGVVSQPRARNAALARAPATRWDAPGNLPPHGVRKAPPPLARPIAGWLASTNTPTSVTLTGSVAVGVVMVSGPRAGRTWTQIAGTLIDVSVSAAGHVWGVNADHEIFERNGNHWSKKNGSLKQISVGDYDQIWGVNAQNQIYRYRYIEDAWERVSGSLKHVSVAADGSVWGVNANDEIYFRSGTSWESIPGRLKQISVGSATAIWGVNADDEIFEWNGNSWTKRPGRLRRISVASDGSVFGVNADDEIYRWLGSEWEKLSGKLRVISAGSSVSLWGVNREQRIFTGAGGTNLVLTDVDKSLLQSEVMGALGFLAAADANANVSFVYDWQEPEVSVVPGQGDDHEDFEAPWRNAALAAMGYAASREGSVAYVRSLIDRERTDWGFVAYLTRYPLYQPGYASDERLVMNSYGWGTLRPMQVMAHETCHIFGAADEYGDCDCESHGHHGIPNNNCVNCTSSPVPCLMYQNSVALCTWTRGQLGWNAWTKMAGALKCVGVGADGSVWGVNDDDDIFRWDGSAWKQVSGALKQISVGDGTHVWGVNADNEIYSWNGTGWTHVGGSLKHVSAASDGSVWGVNSDDDIFVRDGSGWLKVSGALTQISVGGSGNVWGVNSDDEIYRRNGNTWTKISGALVHVSAANDGTVWGVNSDDAIYRYTGSAWERVHGALTQISTGADGLVWGVNGDDKIFRLA